MRDQQVGEIRISSRIARIGHQSYPLANISRVQTLRVVRRGRAATFYPLREIFVLLLLVAAVTVAAVALAPKLHIKTDLDVVHIAHEVAIIAASLAGIRIAWLLGVVLHRLNARPVYILMIETSGTQYAALTGTDYQEIGRIEAAIVSAIEAPPSFEQVLHVTGDVVMGDKIGRDKNVQSGSGNAMSYYA